MKPPLNGERRRLWIGGASLDGVEPPAAVIDPATEEPFGLAAQGGAEDVDRAVAAAQAAFPAWRRVPAADRAIGLHEVAARLRANLETIAVELTRETGRTLRKNRGYVEFSARCFDYYAELALDRRGRVIPSPEASQLSLVLKSPIGVVACIIPWNYPLLLLTWKIAPALAAGNTVVIKPASFTPWTTLGLAPIFEHLPPGVVNVVAGSGRGVGEALIRHPGVRMIAFTGSTQVGQHLMRAAADDVKRLNLELGGKDPLIVCADADLEAAARACVWGAFLNAGQVCTSIERAYIEAAVFPEFSQRVMEMARQLVIGPGMDALTEVTPMIRPEERAKVIAQVQAALDAGAQVNCGGRIPPHRDRGFYYEPTVLTQIPEDQPILTEETFGPVCPLVSVASLEEALTLANRSPYGLGATLFTSDARKAKRYFEEIEAGNVWINDPLIDNLAGPFGGFKRSGLGRELGIEGLEAFTETKHVHWEIEGGLKPWWYPWDA
jgi:acyl-CoA reductase-like NAD-dependent aldehyde dehydrogenase